MMHEEKPTVKGLTGKGKPKKFALLTHRYLIEESVYEFDETVQIGDIIELYPGTFTVKEIHGNALITAEAEESTKKVLIFTIFMMFKEEEHYPELFNVC